VVRRSDTWSISVIPSTLALRPRFCNSSLAFLQSLLSRSHFHSLGPPRFLTQRHAFLGRSADCAVFAVIGGSSFRFVPPSTHPLSLAPIPVVTYHSFIIYSKLSPSLTFNFTTLYNNNNKIRLDCLHSSRSHPLTKPHNSVIVLSHRKISVSSKHRQNVVYVVCCILRWCYRVKRGRTEKVR
jgi:hypothetical protein